MSVCIKYKTMYKLLYKLVHQCVRKTHLPLFNRVIVNVTICERRTTLINPYLSKLYIHVMYNNIVYNNGTINSLVLSNCTLICALPIRRGYLLLSIGPGSSKLSVLI